MNPSITVPLDHEDVVRPRPPTFSYDQLFQLIDSRRSQYLWLLEQLRPLMDGPELAAISRTETDASEPYWDNGYFSGDDARVAYALTRRNAPTSIIEVGSGNSTRFFRKAIRDGGLKTRLISIDPAPRAIIAGLCVEVVPRSVLECNLNVFGRLIAGDFLFIDGSHLAFNGTDSVRIFLEVLPRVPASVLVHFHDIMLPYEYIELFTARGYAEQYLLAVLLLFSDRFTPLLPLYYLGRTHAGAGGVSFWLTS